MKDQLRPHYKSIKATIAAGASYPFVQRCPPGLDRLIGVAITPQTGSEISTATARLDVGSINIIDEETPATMLHGSTSVAPNERFFKFTDFHASCENQDVKMTVKNNAGSPITLTVIFQFIATDNTVK